MSDAEHSILPFRVDQKQPLLKSLARQGRFQLWRLRLALKAALQASDFHGCGNERVFVRPGSIVHDASSLALPIDPGQTRGGGWDHRAKQNSIRGAMTACFHQHFVEGRPWRETSEFVQLTRQFGSNADAESWLANADNLASHLLSEPSRPGHLSGSADWPEISLAVERDGKLAALNHPAAVAIAQSMGLAQIPCRVALRHSQWIRFCKEYNVFGQRVSGGQPYQPSTHIDLAGLVSSWSERRFQIIQDCLQGSRGRLMDIGANLGYFCHRAEELGYDCVAVEACPRLAFFIEKLKQAENRHFQVLCDSVLEHPFEEPYDVVLALNIFHHFLKTEERYQKFVAMLGRMRVREMIFQAHRPHEAQMRKAYRDYLPDDFVQFILDHSCLNKVELLGSDRDRRIYRLRAA